MKAALDLKIPCFTFWGSSLDNVVKRPTAEVKFLFKLFEQYFKKIAKNKEIHQNRVKINVFGRWNELFPEGLKKAIKEAIEKTKNYKNHQLTFLMAYSGKDEMTSAIQGIAKSTLRRGSGREIDGDLIKKNLWTKNLPAVDLVIRTGGEANWSHWSAGLMMWDTSDSQFYSTETLYPDFSVEEFKKAIEKYSQTERRMGR